MRLDKFLKVSRVIKRRIVANEACDAGRIMVNDKVARASYEVKAGDVVTVSFGTREVRFRIKEIRETAKTTETGEMVEYL